MQWSNAAVIFFFFFYLCLHKFCFFSPLTLTLYCKITQKAILEFPYFAVFTGALAGLLFCYNGKIFHFPDCDPGKPIPQSFDQTLHNLRASVALGN